MEFLRHKYVKNMGLALVVIFVSLVMVEVGLRIWGYSNPEFWMRDDRLGMVLRPGIEGWYKKEGKAYVKINSQGLRDRYYPKAKPENTFRIALLADSYGEALQIPRKKTFWHQLKRKLTNCTSRYDQVEVINFGVSGYGTAQEYLMLQEKVWDFSPDMVLLGFLTGNDVRNNSRELQMQMEPWSLRPFYDLKGDSLVLDDSFKRTGAFQLRRTWSARLYYWLRTQFRIFQLVKQVKNMYKRGVLFSIPQEETNSKSEDEIQISLAHRIYKKPRTKEWKKAWNITERLISKMHRNVKRHGADFRVVTLSNGPQVHPDETVKKQFKEKLGVKDLFYPDRRIKQLGEEREFPVLNLAPKFQGYAEEHNVFLHGFGGKSGGGHWNERGHQLASDLIGKWLCEGYFNTDSK